MEVSQNQKVSRLYLKEIVVCMFDSAESFLTTFPQYKQFFTMKRYFHWGGGSDWDKGECFNFAIGEQTDSHTSDTWRFLYCWILQGLGVEERKKA